MDVFPKFIIEIDEELGKCLIIGKATYHKQLAYDTLKVCGGGMWSFADSNKETIVLSGRSFDFGAASIDDISECIKNKKVFSTRTLVNCLADKFKFKYRNECFELIDLPTTD